MNSQVDPNSYAVANGSELATQRIADRLIIVDDMDAWLGLRAQ